jgi:hypothetical protein
MRPAFVAFVGHDLVPHFDFSGEDVTGWLEAIHYQA